MGRTITIDGATVREIRVYKNLQGQLGVQASVDLLSATTIVQQVPLREYTANLQASELSAAQSLLTTIIAAVNRIEVG